MGTWQQRYSPRLPDTQTFGVQHAPEAQAHRLEERQDDTAMGWKLSEDDWLKRQDWDAYMAAYETILNTCATPEASSSVVPANQHWHHNVAVAQLLIERLGPYREEWERTRNQIGRAN